MTLPMHGIHRTKARKAMKLARALATLDDQARLVRPTPKRVTRMSLGV